MRIVSASLIVLLALPGICLAGDVVGKLTARDGVRLDGVFLPSAGVPSWPLHGGSIIETGALPALVLLSNGGRYEIAPNSRAFVETSELSAPELRIQTGPLAQANPEAAVAGPTPLAQQVQRTAAAVPATSALVEISVVDNDKKDNLGDPPPGPPCSGFSPVLVSLGLVRCTP